MYVGMLVKQQQEFQQFESDEGGGSLIQKILIWKKKKER